MVLHPWPVPLAQFPVGVHPDEGLAARVALDPVARLETDARTGQLLLWSPGPGHAELLLDGLPSQPVAVPAGGGGVRLRVRVPSWCASAVRAELAARGEVLAIGARDGAVLEARLPPAELVGCAGAGAGERVHGDVRAPAGVVGAAG